MYIIKVYFHFNQNSLKINIYIFIFNLSIFSNRFSDFFLFSSSLNKSVFVDGFRDVSHFLILFLLFLFQLYSFVYFFHSWKALRANVLIVVHAFVLLTADGLLLLLFAQEAGVSEVLGDLDSELGAVHLMRGRMTCVQCFKYHLLNIFIVSFIAEILRHQTKQVWILVFQERLFH